MEILQYLGPFVGVFLGWFLTKKSESDKIKSNEKKQVKRILFLLLEIRNELMKSLRIDRYLSAFVKKVKEKFGEESSEFSIDNMKPLMKGILDELENNNENFNITLNPQIT
ncbi:MAG: hypothetical protein AB7S50_15625 [Bacteroidales bacterium]